MVSCDSCERVRTPEDHEYHPMQVVLGQPVGWFSSEDEELCTECFTWLMAVANKNA